MGGLILLIVIGTSIWVAVDASSIGARSGLIPGLGGMSPGGWFVACLLLWIVAFPLYLAKRNEIRWAAQAGSGRVPQRVPTPPGHHFPQQTHHTDYLAQRSAAREQAQLPQELPSGPQRSATNAERVPCPWCAELIMPEAVVCRFCGHNVEPAADSVDNDTGDIPSAPSTRTRPPAQPSSWKSPDDGPLDYQLPNLPWQPGRLWLTDTHVGIRPGSGPAVWLALAEINNVDELEPLSEGTTAVEITGPTPSPVGLSLEQQQLDRFLELLRATAT